MVATEDPQAWTAQNLHAAQGPQSAVPVGAQVRCPTASASWCKPSRQTLDTTVHPRLPLLTPAMLNPGHGLQAMSPRVVSGTRSPIAIVFDGCLPRQPSGQCHASLRRVEVQERPSRQGWSSPPLHRGDDPSYSGGVNETTWTGHQLMLNK